MIRAPRSVALAACLLAAPAMGAADDGSVWLERMSRALDTASYVGEFHLEGRGYSERMQIVHCVRDGRVSERLVSLSGAGRELVRDGDEVTAYLPDKKLAIIERRPERDGLLGVLPRYGEELHRWYEVRLETREPELNGRPAAVVSVRPRDGFRFGHRLWIDEATGMPVRTELLDAEGQVVERLRFTRLELRDDIQDSSLQPSVDKTQFRWVRQAAHVPGEAAAWNVRQPPPGFRLSASSVKDIAGVPSPVNQLVLSDGLASVSVFIHAPASGRQPATGAGRAGAASTFSTMVEGQQVTAVGEVPPQTLKAIVNSIVRQD
jgi:sigma-E factor negative regulatory protein RseB